MIEIWKDIKDYEGLYQVSNLGRVKSLSHYVKHYRCGTQLIKERILKQAFNENGYLIVCLTKNTVHKMYRVHRLVAQAFIPNPYNLPTVNHIDENKSNNCVDNLEWCSLTYNIIYSKRKTL